VTRRGSEQTAAGKLELDLSISIDKNKNGNKKVASAHGTLRRSLKQIESPTGSKKDTTLLGGTKD
jgi:hypothetical protein